MYGLSNAETEGWSSPLTVGFLAAGVAILAVFAWVETRVVHPLLPMRVLLDRTRGGSFIAVGVVGAGIFGVFLFLTYYLATVLGYAPLKTGLSFLPMIAGVMLSAQLAPPIVNRIGVKVPISLGFAIATAGLLLLTQLELTSTYVTDILPGLAIIGVGMGFVLGSAISSPLRVSPPKTPASPEPQSTPSSRSVAPSPPPCSAHSPPPRPATPSSVATGPIPWSRPWPGWRASPQRSGGPPRSSVPEP